MGLATLISQSILIFNVLKFIGAAYLFYVGIAALRSKGFSMDETSTTAPKQIMTDWQALRSGFITNLFNPKATLFFLALFTQILDPHIPHWTSAIYGMTCVVMTGIWFSIVATVLTTPAVRARFMRYSKWIDRVCGRRFDCARFAFGIYESGCIMGTILKRDNTAPIGKGLRADHLSKSYKKRPVLRDVSLHVSTRRSRCFAWSEWCG